MWLKAYQAIGQFRHESTFYTWIRRITINCFLNRQRTTFSLARNDWSVERSSRPQTAAGDPASQRRKHAEQPNPVCNVMRALAQLTPRQRLIFLLKHHEGMTYEEIAAAVGCSTGTAKKAVARALVKLREELNVDVPASECVPAPPANTEKRIYENAQLQSDERRAC